MDKKQRCLIPLLWLVMISCTFLFRFIGGNHFYISLVQYEACAVLTIACMWDIAKHEPTYFSRFLHWSAQDTARRVLTWLGSALLVELLIYNFDNDAYINLSGALLLTLLLSWVYKKYYTSLNNKK